MRLKSLQNNSRCFQESCFRSVEGTHSNLTLKFTYFLPLQVCYNKVTVTKNLIEFKKCVSNEVTDAELTSGILPIVQDQKLKQFSVSLVN